MLYSEKTFLPGEMKKVFANFFSDFSNMTVKLNTLPMVGGTLLNRNNLLIYKI